MEQKERNREEEKRAHTSGHMSLLLSRSFSGHSSAAVPDHQELFKNAIKRGKLPSATFQGVVWR
jgi:hypothetical protein